MLAGLDSTPSSTNALNAFMTIHIFGYLNDLFFFFLAVRVMTVCLLLFKVWPQAPKLLAWDNFRISAAKKTGNVKVMVHAQMSLCFHM